MINLKQSLIKLGYTHTDLRPHLRVIIASEEFQSLFGELRSRLNGKKDQRNYEQILRTVAKMDGLSRARTEAEVVPYVHRALDKFPEKVRTIHSLTLRTMDKPLSRYNIEFAKVYNDRSLPSSSLSKDKNLARKVLLGTKANQNIINMSLDNMPITNEEALYVANNFAPKVSSLSFTGRDMPSGTLKKLKVIPYYLSIEGNPRISMDEINAFKVKHPDVDITHDSTGEGPMFIDDLYDEFADNFGGMFDAPDTLDVSPEGAPSIRGTFGRDAHPGREGSYLVEMLPIEEGDTQVRFIVSVKGNGYQHDSVESFDMPKTDDQSPEFSGNRHIGRIVHKINTLLYNVMTDRS